MRNGVLFLVLASSVTLVGISLHADRVGSAQPQACAQGATGTVYRLYVDNVKTAASFSNAAAAKASASDAASFDGEAVALGRNYLLGRLARPGRSFVCTATASNADCRLETVVSSLRSRENDFKGATYGHATKTTMWQLDVIVSLLRGNAVLFSKTRTSSYEERRPISEAQFDNNIFHNLMVAALEQVADDVIDHFDEAESGGEIGSDGVLPAGPVGGAFAAAQTKAPVDSRLSLAVLKPEAHDGVSEQEAAQLWDFIESCVRSGAYRLISRSDLARMQEEIGFTTSSDLVNLASQDRARIGKIKTVSKLLATSVGRVGETYTLAFKVFDSSTAEIETERSRTQTARSIDAFLPLLPALLADVLAAPPSGTVLISAAAPLSMPRPVARALDAELAQALAAAGVTAKSGTEGRVRIVPSIASFAVRLVQDGDGFVYRGSISGSIRVEGAEVSPVTFALEDVELGREQGAAPSWLTQQYGKKLVAMVFGIAEVKDFLGKLLALQ